MTDARTRATLRELERARLEPLREKLRRADERVAMEAEALRALHAERDAEVAARARGREAAARQRRGEALALWADEDDLLRRRLAALNAAIGAAEQALARAQAGRADAAREIAERLARLSALREASAPDERED